VAKKKSMKIIKITLFLSLFCVNGITQKINNHFFALHNIIRGDSVYSTFDQQVLLIKNAGFDGVEINSIDSFEGMQAAIEKHQFKGSYFYVRIHLDDANLDPRIKKYIAQLKGTQTIISPFILKSTKSISTQMADSLTIARVSQIADWANKAKLQVAIYPHYSFYVERTQHAFDLAKRINKKNVGLSFNLCHWLATTNESERKNLKNHLISIKSKVKMLTICGANDVVTSKKNIWDDYILPLGTGGFDTKGLVKMMVGELKYKGAIGVQCYNIKGDKVALINQTMKYWRGNF
jgi:sugar phosphate isomerase/epimerase